ncbi:MAG TPA: glycerate kinase [Actinomycetota bacterium]|nr:glycerate kinase [Actinomycetota bacterium]
MRVVVAPDKFKGTLTAKEAAVALSAGWRRVDPRADVDEVPVADGGDGTLDALLGALGGRRERVTVTGPLGDPVDADFGLVEGAGGLTAVVEMARASGLELVSEARRDPLRATTRGTGELIAAAAQHAPRRLIVCIGGSATNDGGAGMAQALGVRLLDDRGSDLRPGGEALRRLQRIDARALLPAARRTDVVVACDVDNPLTGPHGASAVYGPQKGASPEDVRVLDDSLGHFATVVSRDLGIDVRDLPGAGAAGGLGAGLVAFLGARLRPGFEVVADALGLERRLEGADVAVTGEGRYDAQTESGKAPAGVLEMARRAGCRTALVAGQIEGGAEPRADLVYDLAARHGRDAAFERTRELLEEAAAEAATELTGDGGA